MIVLADPDPRLLKQLATQLGRQDVTTVDSLEELEAFLAEQDGETSVAMIGPGFPIGPALKLAERVQLMAPELSVLLFAKAFTSEVLQAALRAGIRDVLPASCGSRQLTEAVTRAEALSHQIRARGGNGHSEAEEAADHQMITVFSSKGGVGKSFIASNLAVLLSRKAGSTVALVDLSLESGDLAIMLQLFPSRTIYDAAQTLDRLDQEALRGYLTVHATKVSLLAAPLEPGLAETVSAEAVRQILAMLKESFSYVVVDTPPVLTDHVLAALDESQSVVLVTSMDVPSIKNMKLALQTLDLLGIKRERTRVVLNRADSKVGLRLQDVEKTLETNIDVSIPSSREVPLSINRGNPLVVENPHSVVAGALSRLAQTVEVAAKKTPRAASAHWFTRRR